MLKNESPFLQTPEKLEYPNHTWTAQDLRKANLFYIASLYSEDKKTEYLKAAYYYVHYVEETLKDEETRYFSRILILLKPLSLSMNMKNRQTYFLISLHNIPYIDPISCDFSGYFLIIQFYSFFFFLAF